ncbi:MAG: small multi-drug export protein, partial [Clostridia bacterium]|nr:small multi-drug export protein [Clostridia bacterium]
MDVSGLMDISSVWVLLIVMLLSMIPMVESRIGIPIGVSADIWGTGTLDVWQSMLAGIIGSSVAGVVLVLLYHPIKRYLARSKMLSKIYNAIGSKLLNKFNRKKKENVDINEVEYVLQQQKKYRAKVWGLLLFMILPVPGSGVWSTAVLGGILGLKNRDSIMVVVLGSIVSCAFVAVLSAILLEYITLALIIGVIIGVLYGLCKALEVIISACGQ